MEARALRVHLLAHTPDPERVVALSARLCYSESDPSELDSRLSDSQVHTLLRKLREIGHFSPWEHALFTFSVAGISRTCLAQLTRHRIASYSVRSQRYVQEDDFSYVVPPTVERKDEAAKLFHSHVKQQRQAYMDLIKLGIPKEDARFVLPGAATTNLILSMNARELTGSFFLLRTCTRAQWEIRRLANKMLALARDAAPVLFETAGPACVSRGHCSEGEMSCGRYKRIQSVQAKTAATADGQTGVET